MQSRGTGAAIGRDRRLWLVLLVAVVSLAWELAGEASRPPPNVTMWVLDHTDELPPPPNSSDALVQRRLEEQVSLGLRAHPVWLRVVIHNVQAGQRLVFSNPLVQGIELFGCTANDCHPVRRAAHFADNEGVAAALPQFVLPDGVSEYLLKVVTNQAIRFDLTVLDDAQLHHHWRQLLLGQGLYFGLIAGLAAYNSLLLFSLRDGNYLWYLGFLSGSGLYFLSQNGLLMMLFPHMGARLNEALLLSSLSVISIFGIQFCRRFLRTPFQDPWVDRLMRWLCWPLCAAIAVAWLLPSFLTVVIYSVLGALVLAAFLVSSLRGLWRGFRPAQWLLMAWSVLVVGVSLLLLVTYGIIPHNVWTLHGFQMGSGLEAILLSLALADRISLLQHERETLLEEKARLHGMSYLDGLTGVHNRRYLDEALPAAIAQAEASEHPLSLIMLDIDNFKRFNDGWGHAEGDRALQHLGTVIEDVVRDVDPVCRYGGEEFVILLKERDEHQAMEVAERIRHGLASTPLLLHSGESVLLTCTLGVARRQRGESASDLLRRADQALYRGKYAGRDRVVLNASAVSAGDTP
ncbi:sensor domain-containing diguanylate cyclase [Halomonas sp. DP5Y7-2]|uniref:GGDEF domain-containing protein n=1 Tax=Halomonas sp. DP5Y7-2 TaxID=2859076 RepID=UPI001C9959FC|nr:GGDEF domain-containing protein [Halomonas sp. DP5Y7-2]MBY5983033.1 sensor domain-containing diguanylate cyclase [Halomonas sp. DP5Y7-2]